MCVWHTYPLDTVFFLGTLRDEQGVGHVALHTELYVCVFDVSRFSIFDGLCVLSFRNANCTGIYVRVF